MVSLLLNYHTKEKQTDVEAPKIASYAFGDDYHNVIKDKLKQLMSFIHQEIGEVGGRVFVDSAPVMDKAWAAKSGLGWIGKNTNKTGVISGSFLMGYGVIRFFIEFFRQPDAHMGFITLQLSMGQILSIPMFMIGLILLTKSLKKYEAIS